jgi:hypothetical protein
MNIYLIVKKPGQIYYQCDYVKEAVVVAFDEKQCEEVSTISGETDITLIGIYTGPETRAHVVCSDQIN